MSAFQSRNVPAATVCPARQHDETAGVAIGKWAQQHAVHDGEDRRARADPERECERGNNRETRCAPQESQRVAGVASKLVEPGDAPGVATLVLPALDAAHRPQGQCSCLVGRHSARDVLLDLAFYMVAELLVELLLDAGATEERPQAERYGVDPVFDAHRSGLAEPDDG